MGGYYRLKELGFHLGAGAQVLKAADIAPIGEATLVLERAEAEAARIREEAQEAFRQEKQRGYEEGLAEARAHAVERLIEENTILDAGLRKAEQDLARLVSAAVRKLIDGFDDHIKAEAVVRSALKQMRQEKRTQLRVSAAQYAHFRGAAEAMLKEFPEIELIDVVEDPMLRGAHVIVESSIGRVDGDLGRRIDDLEAIVRRSLVKAADAGGGGEA